MQRTFCSFYKERKRTQERFVLLKKTQKNARMSCSFEKNVCPTLICTGFLWDREWYIFVPASRERESCTYLYQLPVRERELYIFVQASCEIEICTYLYRLPWERELYIFVPSSCEREICTKGLLQQATTPIGSLPHPRILTSSYGY